MKQADDMSKIALENKQMLEKFEEIAQMSDFREFRLPEFSLSNLNRLLDHVSHSRNLLEDARQDAE